MRNVLGIVAAFLLLAGCGSEDTPAATAGSAPWHDGTKPATAASKIGGRDTPCQLPVTVDIPDKWKAAGLSAGEAGQAGLDLLCEVDAKPAGAIGFIRVWAGQATDTRKALESWVAAQDKTNNIEYRDTSVGQGSGVEATWISEETGRRRAFAVSTQLKTVVFTTGGIDEEEYAKMLPALLLAKQSLTPLER
jgi:hypothetical protein